MPLADGSGRTASEQAMNTEEVVRTIEALQQRVKELQRQTAQGIVQPDQVLAETLTAVQHTLATLQGAAEQRSRTFRTRAGAARHRADDGSAQQEQDPAAELCQAKGALQKKTRQCKQAKTAPQESRNLLHGFVESLPDPLFVKDVQGRYELINTAGARFLGTSVEDVIGKADVELLPSPMARRIRKEDITVIETGKTQTYEDTFTMGEDTRTYLSTKGVYRDQRGQVRGVISLARDITERKQEEETLRKREQRYRELALEREQQLILSDRLVWLGELAASLVHEFNNPLGIIQGFAQDLAREATPAAPHYQPLKIIEEEARRCVQLMTDLLEFARPTRADLRRTDLVEVMRKTLELVSVRLRKGKIKTALKLQPNLPPVHADPQQLQQVLLNVFFNAIEAMPDGGCLTVRVTTHQAPRDTTARAHQAPRTEIRIAVTDTGMGIQARDLPKIFRPFFTTKTKGGMGLGLSICESIIHAHGGRIEVGSTPGQGTIVSVLLPVKGGVDEDST